MLEGAIPAYLRERILSSRYFVVLLGQSQTPTGWQPSLSSRTLLQQLTWALEADKTVIAVTHSGYSLPETQGDLSSDTWRRVVALHEGHLLTIPEETTSAHDTALSQLLNILGYGAY